MTVVDKNLTVKRISQRLSLRRPQVESLRRLSDIVDMISPSKGADVDAAREAVRRVYGSMPDAGFEEFERNFPSICFALATGVGKTRLMGAFISYLYMIGASKNFFVLAPNLTIYNKLLLDFHPSGEKYVFRGIDVFSTYPPMIVNAENFHRGHGVRGTDFFGLEGAVINIFNISKIDSKTGTEDTPLIRRLQEYVGDSYFSYLSNLDDLVLIMDEAHRYRASAGTQAIANLSPILGLEVTATPRNVGARSGEFKNVVYRFDLPDAMISGYVKEPAVGTRANFDSHSVDESMMEKIKLEDGIRYHEHVRVALRTYSMQNNVDLVHPFMLVVTQDTEHARNVSKFVQSEEFFDGQYKDRVVEIHSKLRGAESDDNSQRLLNIERSGDVDIVIHVNKLKEGWDVKNLFTIVPLRSSASEILTEQTLGRGLRLPYGKRTGVEAIDTLTVIAHDRFEEIIEKAKQKSGLIHKIKTVTIGEGGGIIGKPVVVKIVPFVQQTIIKSGNSYIGNIGASGTIVHGRNRLKLDIPTVGNMDFESVDETNFAQVVLDVISDYTKSVSTVDEIGEIEGIRKIVKEAQDRFRSSELFAKDLSEEDSTRVAESVCKFFVQHTIAIPVLKIEPREEMSFGFRRFDVDMTSWNYLPASRELVIQGLRTDRRSVISAENISTMFDRTEDYIVQRLSDMPEIDYDKHSDVLYDLAQQVVAHFEEKYSDDDKVQSIIQAHASQIAEAIFAQMRQHMWRSEVSYVVSQSAAYESLEPLVFSGVEGESMRDFRKSPDQLRNIRGYIFSGFKKSCYSAMKFDSDTERRMSVVLEDDESVLRWMKLGPNQLRIFDEDGNRYQPDFVVETESEKLIIETKRDSEISSEQTLKKANAAALWCHAANLISGTGSERKMWSYVLVPDAAVLPNSTINGLVSRYTKSADVDLLSRYTFLEAEDA